MARYRRAYARRRARTIRQQRKNSGGGKPACAFFAPACPDCYNRLLTHQRSCRYQATTLIALVAGAPAALRGDRLRDNAGVASGGEGGDISSMACLLPTTRSPRARRGLAHAISNAAAHMANVVMVVRVFGWRVMALGRNIVWDIVSWRLRGGNRRHELARATGMLPARARA